MTTIIEQIKRLRQETGAGVLDCRLALEQAGGDLPQALDALRAKAQAAAAQRAGRPAQHGVFEVYAHGGGRIGVMVEVNCETDFAARSPAFRAFAHELALQIAAAAPEYVRDEDVPPEVLAEQAEQAAAQARRAGKPEAVVERIVAGQLDKFRQRRVLLRQPSVRDDSLRVETLLHQAAAAVGENIVVGRFVRWEREPESE